MRALIEPRLHMRERNIVIMPITHLTVEMGLNMTSCLYLSLDEIYERKLTSEQLHAAIASLPDKQAKRIYAHYFMGMSKTAIAKAAGVNKSQISRSIAKALRSMEKFLKTTY